MTFFEGQVTVAAVQGAPVFLDRDATADLLMGHITQAAAQQQIRLWRARRRPSRRRWPASGDGGVLLPACQLDRVVGLAAGQPGQPARQVPAPLP